MILGIDELRKSVDSVDREILKNLAKRKELVKEIAALKKSMKIPVNDSAREKSVLDSLKKQAKENGLSQELIDSIYNLVFENSKIEQEIKNSDYKCRIKEIGLIGFGRFGRLAAKYLSEDFRVYVTNKNNKINSQKNIIPSTLDQVCKKPVVIIAVPISEFENTLKNAEPLLKKDSLVIDVCSVKEHPASLMKKILPKSVQVLGTHPLFGPDTASDSIVGRKIVLCKARINTNLHELIKSFLKSKGLVVIETTPREHDRQIAKSLVLTHMIGRALIGMKAGNVDIDTMGYRALIKILDTVRNDSLQLFQDMNRYNRFAKKERQKFIGSLERLNKVLG